MVRPPAPAPGPLQRAHDHQTAERTSGWRRPTKSEPTKSRRYFRWCSLPRRAQEPSRSERANPSGWTGEVPVLRSAWNFPTRAQRRARVGSTHHPPILRHRAARTVTVHPDRPSGDGSPPQHNEVTMTVQIRPALASLPAYAPGRTVPGSIKLASNELSFPTLPAVSAAILDAVGTDASGIN